MAMQSLQTESGFVDNWQSGKSLKECNLHMLTSEDSCDVNFRVGKDEKIIRAHRYVLISRSCVFHAMLCGPLAEKEDIKITDVDADIFTEFLRFLYTDESTPSPGNVTALLYLAKKYALGGLELICLNYLETSLSAVNACVVLEQAYAFDEKQLYDRAFKVIIENAEKCFDTQGFTDLSRDCFDKVLSSDDLGVKPEHIFNAALKWSAEECVRTGREATPANLRSALGQTLYMIPFPNMAQTFYVKEVLPKQILTSEENVTIMATLLCPDSDPSPFKRQEVKTKLHDVVFYDNNRTVTGRLSLGVAGRIDFTCDRDVLLCGVYIYGSVRDTNTTYHIKVQKYGELGYLENSRYTGASETALQEGRVIAIHLGQPIAIKKDISYYLYVEVRGSGPPMYEGDGYIRKINVNQYTFTKLPVENTYVNCLNLIHGFIVH